MIDVKNLSFRYHKNGPQILDNLSFAIEKGEVLAVLGKNGIGKTTFIKCLTSELKNYSGEILIDGTETREYSVPELSKKIAVVASNSPSYQNLIVADYLVTGFANQLTALQVPDDEKYEKAAETISELGYNHLFNREIFGLSSGEFQIVKIARAILQDPSIIVFDEPTSNLDVNNQLLVLSQITGLSNRGYTIITTTHNPGQAIELNGKVLLMTGKETIFGHAAKILTEPNLKNTYGLDVEIEDGKYRHYAVFSDKGGKHRLIY